MTLRSLLRDIILIAIGINITCVAVGYMLGNEKLIATAFISLTSLIVAIAIKAYDIFD